ncbi:MAG: hypothetical protein IIB27_00265 [Chloroflexi bacterium]|nr:hypothetical protein [Chloroflexota bacterium]MCH7641648.1 hypothetical protein [Chloroflexota bacterium]
MSNDVIGVRLTRNAPVLFVDGNRLTLAPGDLVVIELFDGETEIEASVVVGAGQLLNTSAGKLAGRALRAV